MVARAASNVVYHQGRRVVIRKGRTTAAASHPIVTEHPRLWEPLRVDYPAPAPAPESDLLDVSTFDQEPGTEMIPGPDPGSPDVVTDEPKPAQVRAWARGQGIGVSASGKVSAGLVEQYKAATHG
jgi:hypothetical protein